jgi:hypothetical protein
MWIYTNDGKKLFAGTSPESLFDDGVCIKKNPVRKVIKSNNFFIKYDKRFFNGLLKEFLNAKKLERSGIPVVKHLAVSRHYLVTLAEKNAVELKDFLLKNIPSDEMLTSFGAFLRMLRKKKLYHTDLHSGNILYIPAENRFVLVDVRSADCGFRFSSMPDSWYIHIIMEMRRYLSKSKLFELYSLSGLDAQKKFFETDLESEFEEIADDWQRREKQIISGYGKFVKVTDGITYSADAPENISGGESISVPDPMAYMLLHHYLELNHIPHRPVWAITGNSVTLGNTPERHSAPETSLADEYCKRLEICGIASTCADWIICDGKISFINLASGVAQISRGENK